MELWFAITACYGHKKKDIGDVRELRYAATVA